MSTLSDHFEHATQRIGFGFGPGLPEYAAEMEESWYSTICPTFEPYVRVSTDAVHGAMEMMKDKAREAGLGDQPPTMEGLLATGSLAGSILGSLSLYMLCLGAAVGSGDLEVHGLPEDREDYVEAWRVVFATPQALVGVDTIFHIYSTDLDLSQMVTMTLSKAADHYAADGHNLPPELEIEDVWDVWHAATHRMQAHCYLAGFEMGKAMHFERELPV